jgi:hypothetical protein
MGRPMPGIGCGFLGKGEYMARYCKVEIRMWGDEKFASLSPLKPSGQALWLALLIGPWPRFIPGVIPVGLGALSDTIRWKKNALLKFLNEIRSKKMIDYDMAAGLIVVHNALRLNFPTSSKVVLGWRNAWLDVPECPLKKQLAQQLRAVVGAKFPEAVEAVLGRYDSDIISDITGDTVSGTICQANSIKEIVKIYPPPPKGEKGGFAREQKEQKATEPTSANRRTLSDHPHLDIPATRLAQKYEQSVTMAHGRGAKTAIVELLAQHINESELETAITNYATFCQTSGIDPTKRKSGAVFFRSGVWREYLTPVPDLPEMQFGQNRLPTVEENMRIQAQRREQLDREWREKKAREAGLKPKEE